MPGLDSYGILGEHYMMADGSQGQLSRAEHNAQFETVANEVTTAITDWRTYLGDNWEWDRGSRPLDTGTGVKPDGYFNYKT